MLRSTCAVGLFAIFAVAGSPVGAQAQTAPSAPPAPVFRGSFGISAGVMQFGGTATFDYSNSSTPLAGASGPYTGAVLTTKHVGPGVIFSAGYRGPVKAGSKLGFGIDGKFGGGGGHPADQSVAAKSPSGATVTFTTEKSGIVDLVMVSGGGHLSYALGSRVRVRAGAEVSSLRVKAGFGSYLGPSKVSSFLAAKEDKSPTFWRTAVAPTVGAELLFSNHTSLDLAASFQPQTSQHLADSPWGLSFTRSRTWASASLRIFF